MVNRLKEELIGVRLVVELEREVAVPGPPGRLGGWAME
jgi:hypothetical protein